MTEDTLPPADDMLARRAAPSKALGGAAFFAFVGTVWAAYGVHALHALHGREKRQMVKSKHLLKCLWQEASLRRRVQRIVNH